MKVNPALLKELQLLLREAIEARRIQAFADFQAWLEAPAQQKGRAAVAAAYAKYEAAVKARPDIYHPDDLLYTLGRPVQPRITALRPDQQKALAAEIADLERRFADLKLQLLLADSSAAVQLLVSTFLAALAPKEPPR